MAKENTFYFTHDYNTRSDKKIKKLLSKTGIAGYGVFWAIIEDLYNNANEMPLDYEIIAYDLKTDESLVKSVIDDFDLFIFNDDHFGSMSVQRRLDERNHKSNKARESVLKRWNKSERNTTVLQENIDCNTIKESKVKESKENEIINEHIELGDKSPPIPNISSNELKIQNRIIRESEFYKTLVPYVKEYDKKTIREFFDYWREPNRSGSKMRWEMGPTWELKLRLKTWIKNDDRWNKQNSKINENQTDAAASKIEQRLAEKANASTKS